MILFFSIFSILVLISQDCYFLNNNFIINYFTTLFSNLKLKSI